MGRWPLSPAAADALLYNNNQIVSNRRLIKRLSVSDKKCGMLLVVGYDPIWCVFEGRVR